MGKERNIDEFNMDVAAKGGYAYTATDKLSCRLSNERITRAVLELAELAGKRVIDIGCGDGTYSLELHEAGAMEVLGVDAADAAIERARETATGLDGVHFEAVDVYALEEPETRFDVAVVRGILHHLYDVEKAIERISRVAHRIVVVEPNGYNPVLKIIEKVSPYHVEHEEKSYSPRSLDGWFEKFGGHIEESKYVGLVPFFCPDFAARFFKAFEPLTEALPVVRSVCCGQYVQRIAMS